MPKPQPGWEPFALLLIDVQQDFWTESQAANFPDFPANVARLLKACRALGLDVIHLHASFKPDQSDWMARYRLRGTIPCIQGTPGIKTLPFAVEAPGEAVLIKHSFDGFQNPDLLAYLHLKGKRFILTAGLVTSTCVFLTAASAAQSGFLTAIVADCCADDLSDHEQTLARYRFMFDLTTSDQLAQQQPLWLEQLQKLSNPSLSA